MKLEIKHLVGYLPYKLNCMAQGEGKQSFEFQGISDITWIYLHEIGRTACEQYDIEDVFPILRPLSDITNQNIADMTEYSDFENIYFNGKPSDLIFTNTEEKTYLSDILNNIDFLFKNHFDIYRLIEAGLAIDINTLNK